MSALSLAYLPIYTTYGTSVIPSVLSRGWEVAIAIHKQCPFIPTDHLADPNGWYVFLKGTILQRKFTFAVVYVPDTGQLSFLDSVLDSLSSFREGQLILGGDFNASPEPHLDISLGHSTHSFAFLKEFLKSLYAHHLVACWRVLHPTGKDFSYYSAVHMSTPE